jgi:hypothetical protein
MIFLKYADAQQLQLLDRFNDNKLVNDLTVTAFSSDTALPEITQYFTMRNNTDKRLVVFLKKTVNFYADSTSDYYCFGPHCWPGNDTTNVGDTIEPGGEDYTFASHVCHIRRFDKPPLPLGLSSITYTVYDKTTFPQPVEATVTVIYHMSGVGIEEAGKPGGGEAGKTVVVYPNPATDFLTVQMPENQPGNYNLIVISSLGNQVENKTIHLDGNIFSFPLINYPTGIYFGRLISSQGRKMLFKFQVL